MPAIAGPQLAVVLNLTIFLAGLGLLLVLLIALAALHRPPTRPCLNCGEPVEVMARRCRHCGYRYVFFHFRR